MVLEVIYVTRHGFRVNWVQDPKTGAYQTNVPSPTGIPSDPPLAGYGVQQAKQLAEHLITLDPPVDRVYSSPFYRCLETLAPTVEKLRERGLGGGEIRGDNGLGEWYGTARFDHPSPGTPDVLRKFFPTYSQTYTPTVIPSRNGETIDQLHDRCAYAMSHIIADLDAEVPEPKAVLLCTHAASLIAIGRVLTGNMPEDANAEDFKPFTCGLSKFVRRSGPPEQKEEEEGFERSDSISRDPITRVDWRGGNGVAGGWDCVLNGDCSFLDGGEERGWHFSGDESFMTGPEEAFKAPDAQTEAEAQAAVNGEGRGAASDGSGQSGAKL